MNTAQEHASILRQHLHDLCQPLTRLQWRLGLGQHSSEPDELRDTIQGALADSNELIECIRRIRASIETQAAAQRRAA